MRKADFAESFVRRGAVTPFGQVVPRKWKPLAKCRRQIQTAQQSDFRTKKWPRGRGHLVGLKFLNGAARAGV
jgi:hypothetical protein